MLSEWTLSKDIMVAATRPLDRALGLRPGAGYPFWNAVLEAILAVEDLDNRDECQAAFDRTLREFRAPGASGDTLKAPPPWMLSPN